jgi:peptidoglycan/xylan/chitin deacetylase (PgdA/CDA1 family)
MPMAGVVPSPRVPLPVRDLGGGSVRAATGAGRRPLCLNYHGVADVRMSDDPYRLFIHPRDLVRHIEALRAWGYALVTFGEWSEAVVSGTGAGLAALTFDDGFSDNLHTLVPILADLQAPATVFVVSSWLGQMHRDVPWARMLTADEVVALDDAGVEIGGHSVSHPDLTRLSFDDARAELARGRADLEDLLGKPVEVAAYPYGFATAETRRACRDAGYRAACRTVGAGCWDDPFDLPREDLGNCSGALELRLAGHGRYRSLIAHKPIRGLRRAYWMTRDRLR